MEFFYINNISKRQTSFQNDLSSLIFEIVQDIAVITFEISLKKYGKNCTRARTLLRSEGGTHGISMSHSTHSQGTQKAHHNF